MIINLFNLATLSYCLQIPKSFLSWIIQELKTCVLLKISLEMTISLEVMKFLGLTTSLIIISSLDVGYLDSLVSSFVLIHTPYMLTWSRNFQGFCLFFSIQKKDDKDADAGSPWLCSVYARDFSIKGYVTKSDSIRDTSTRAIYARDLYIKSTFSEGGCTKCIWVRNTSAKRTYVRYIIAFISNFDIVRFVF